VNGVIDVGDFEEEAVLPIRVYTLNWRDFPMRAPGTAKATAG
jgi:hypothetical protein